MRFPGWICVLVAACWCLPDAGASGEGREIVLCGRSWNPDVTALRCGFADDITARDWKKLRRFRRLEALHLSLGPGIEDLSGLGRLKRLKRLTIEQAHDVVSIAWVSSLRRLEVFELWSSRVRDLRPLSRLRQLERLSLSEARELEDVGSLGTLGGLEELSLSGTKVSDLTPLAGLKDLRTLRLGCEVRELGPVGRLTGLEKLHLCARSLRDLAPLRPLQKLKVLWISRANGLDLAPVAELTGLKLIDVRMSSVEHLASLQKLPHLEKLRLCLLPDVRNDVRAIRRARRDIDVWEHNGCRATVMPIRVTDP
jgi:Leucine-rich repeat (LRR) protein